MGVSEYPEPGQTTKPRNNYRAEIAKKKLIKQRKARKLERINRKRARA